MSIRSLSAVTIAAATLLPSAASATRHIPTAADPAVGRYETSRTFHLGPGSEVRWFTLRERGGVILLNRLTVPRGVRAVVDARIPHLAGARVISWPDRNDPSLSCRAKGGYQVCTQSEEWCPMPQATWHFHLVKLSGPAGPVRFDYLVAPPPRQR